MAGLYAGITFSKDPAAGSDEVLASTSASAGSSSTATARAPAEQQQQSDTERQRQAALADAEAYAAQQAELAAKEAAENARKAALGFQPIVRKRPVPAKGRPTAPGAGSGSGSAAANGGGTFGSASPAGGSSAATTSNATISAAPSLFDSAANAGGDPSRASTSASASIISAPPMELKDLESSTKTTGAFGQGRTLNVPPSMTLDDGEDVNGFRATQAGKKAANKSKKKKNKNKKEEDPALAWTAEYDPARPTDYSEYKAYSRMLRAEKRAQLVREREREKRRRMAESYGESGSGSEYTESDEDDSDAERRKRIANAHNRFFAPPTSYDASSAAPPTAEEAGGPQPAVVESSRSPYEASAAPATTSTSHISKPAAEEDDPWASWSAAPKEADDPFARRVALSQQQTRGASPPSRPPPPTAPAPFSSSSTAPYSDPYLQPPSQFSPPPFPPTAPDTSFSSMPPPPMFHHVGAPSVPTPPGFGQQSPHQSFPMPPNLFPPGVPPMPPAQASMPTLPPSQPEQTPAAKSVPIAIEEAQARARAIAARLASLGKPGLSGKSSLAADDTARPASFNSPNPYGMPQAPSADEPIPGLGAPSVASAPQAAPSGPSPSQGQANARPEDFAKNLMAKYGWEKGQGLGASSQGIVNPLALANSQQGGKGKHKQEQHQQQQPSRGGPVGIATSKGRIVSDIKTEKEREEKAKYGEPTRVVCLSNMVGRNEVDDELVSDVADEARKLGIMEKCFVHVQPPYVPEDDAVRVFIVFSGLVGAWKAVKAFDGRYFGGRNVKAKFYSEQAADMGVLHL